MKRLPARAVLLFSDATILRGFPPLRYAWAFRGEQAQVKITGPSLEGVEAFDRGTTSRSRNYNYCWRG